MHLRLVKDSSTTKTTPKAPWYRLYFPKVPPDGSAAEVTLQRSEDEADRVPLHAGHEPRFLLASMCWQMLVRMGRNPSVGVLSVELCPDVAQGQNTILGMLLSEPRIGPVGLLLLEKESMPTELVFPTLIEDGVKPRLA